MDLKQYLVAMKCQVWKARSLEPVLRFQNCKLSSDLWYLVDRHPCSDLTIGCQHYCFQRCNFQQTFGPQSAVLELQGNSEYSPVEFAQRAQFLLQSYWSRELAAGFDMDCSEEVRCMNWELSLHRNL